MVRAQRGEEESLQRRVSQAQKPEDRRPEDPDAGVEEGSGSLRLRRPASAVHPTGCGIGLPDSTESQVEDTEDPWELQRLHDAWLAKEFFYKKKKTYFYGPI